MCLEKLNHGLYPCLIFIAVTCLQNMMLPPPPGWQQHSFIRKLKVDYC